MQQPPKVDNSENDLLYSLSSAFDISPSSAANGMDSVFSGPSPVHHARSISSDSMLFGRPAHPSLDLYYKTNHSAGPLRRPEKSPQLSVTPPSPYGTHRLPTMSATKRRSRSQAYSDDEDLDGPLPGDATEQEKIDYRRRQNTLAARKSRKRKQDHLQQLQDDVQRLSKEKDVWRERALMLKQLLISHGLPSPNFDR